MPPAFLDSISSPTSASEDAPESDGGSSRRESEAAPPSGRVPFDLGSDDDEAEESGVTARYVKGSVGMARGVFKNMPSVLRKVYRYGVLVIDISDGGSLLFYSNSLLTDKPSEEIRAGINRGSGVSVYTSIASFEEPSIEPYLRIPANVPWIFKVEGGSSFHIVVPPLNGKLDCRVELKKYTDMLKKRVINNRGADEWSMASEHYDGLNLPKKKSHLFVFRSKRPGEVAVYAKAAQSLGRNRSGNAERSIMPVSKVRTRTQAGIDIANQNKLIGRGSSVMNLSMGRSSTLGQEEFRCYPLYCYPNTWMTKKDLVAELPRKSKEFHDLRSHAPGEIGNLRLEVLQCIGLPKCDRYGLSDAYCFVVCGSNCFVTDVIPENSNPCWLPMTRRACILPIHNAYAQVYVGVFDYDGEGYTDDFIGRVVIDVPQLPPGRTLSVTLPLRECSRVYTVKPLGSIRLRLQLNWTNGERDALLSYFPRNVSDVKKRMRSPTNTVTVACPDAKSFYNVALTVYGKDTPGQYNSNMKDSVFREVEMIQKMLIYQTKRTIRDVIFWRNPAISFYLFYGWMHFGATASGTFLATFILSLLFLFMLRNYLKYHVNSAASRLFGHTAISGMTRILLFNQDGHRVPKRSSNTLERMLIRVLGISPTYTHHHGQDSWKWEDHAEFPLSIGSIYSKVSSDEAAARPIWEAKQDNLDNFSDESFHEMSDDGADHDDSDDETYDQSAKNVFAKIPDQDVCKIPEKKKKTLGTQIHEFHYKVQRKNFHLFDDRVFIAEDRSEAKKVLKMYSKNPISKRINPLMANVVKIFEYEVSAFRALFNILFWKDPMLSYWAMVFVLCLMIVVLIVPWRQLYFVVGLLLLGPQNYFLMDRYLKLTAKKERPSLTGSSKSEKKLNIYLENERSALGDSGGFQCSAGNCISNALLLRNNTEIKPDGKLRKVIVPSAPFRYNRFYDWPPDPDSTTIK